MVRLLRTFGNVRCAVESLKGKKIVSDTLGYVTAAIVLVGSVGHAVACSNRELSAKCTRSNTCQTQAASAVQWGRAAALDAGETAIWRQTAKLRHVSSGGGSIGEHSCVYCFIITREVD